MDENPTREEEWIGSVPDRAERNCKGARIKVIGCPKHNTGAGGAKVQSDDDVASPASWAHIKLRRVYRGSKPRLFQNLLKEEG
jgi:hypothetical protein